jgi:hypothetical protein
LHINEAG